MLHLGNFDEKGKISDVNGIKLIPELNYYSISVQLNLSTEDLSSSTSQWEFTQVNKH